MEDLERILQALSPKWFDRATVYTGSEGAFRYRFRREKDTVFAAVYRNVCYEKATDVEEREFPRTEEGVAELRQWVQERYEAFLAQK